MSAVIRNIMSSLGLVEALREQGYDVPKDCVDAKLVMDVDAPMTIRFECHISPEDLVKLGKAFAALGARRLV